MFPTHVLAKGAFVKNLNDEILLVKTYNRAWQIPGGQVENGEDLVEVVIREVKEESGIDISVNTTVECIPIVERILGMMAKGMYPLS